MGGVSVVIVSWNARDYLRECLLSVRKTAGAVVKEIIVIDNASSDGSPEMVAAEFRDVMLIRATENLGFARANNLALERASGSWLALVNSDVVVHPDCFQQLVKYLESHDEVGLVGPKLYGTDGEIQRSCRRLPTIWNTTCRVFGLDNVLSRWALFSGREMRHWKHDEQAEVEVISGCFWLARREAIKQVGVLDERFFFYSEDMDWCRRFREAGWKVVFVPKATATHFGGGSSANAPFRYSVEMLRANLAYWRKHRGAGTVALFYALCVLHHALRLSARGMFMLSSASKCSEAAFKFRRSQVCLHWLITGSEPERG